MRVLKFPAVLFVVCSALALVPTAVAAPTGSTDGATSDKAHFAVADVNAGSQPVDKVLGRYPTGTPDKVRAARAFLEHRAKALGLQPDLADLTLAGRSDDIGGTVLSFAQRHGGVPVMNASVIVGFEPGGDIIHVDNGYVPDLDVPGRPQLSKATAIAAAEQTIGARLPSSRRVRLVVAPGDKAHPGHHLAWEVTAPTTQPLGDWQVLVDSQDGGVISSVNRLKRSALDCVPADPATDFEAAFVFEQGPIDALDDPTLTTADNVDAAMTGCELGNLTSSTDLTGTYVNTSHTPAPRAAPPYTSVRSVNEVAVDEATVYYHLNRSKEYLDLLGFPGVMNYSIPVNAADPSAPNNAFYMPSQKRIGMGTGVVHTAQDPDVIYHEGGHAIQDDQVPGWGQDLQGGSMGEGFGDYWAAALTEDSAATALGPACVGAWFGAVFYPYDGTSGSVCLRRVDGSQLFPRDQTFEVHDDGELWSAALWRLRTVLGGAVTDRLVIKSHTFLQPDARFVDGADALHSADVALHDGAHTAVIDAAMEASGIPRSGPPVSSVGLTSTEAANCATTHPYTNLDYVECTFVKPGATRMRVHFSSFDTEHGWDFVYVSDAHLGQTQALTGSPFATSDGGFSATVNGDTIVVRFKADSSIPSYGFTIDGIEWAADTVPQANPDSYSHFGSDTALAVAAPGVLVNDTGDVGKQLTISVVSPPSHGTVTLFPDGSFSYQPHEDFVGTDSFTYAAHDGIGASAAATVTLTVGAGCEGRQATITGTSSANNIKGTSRDDVIAAFGGTDIIQGGAGHDIVCGGSGRDEVRGDNGDDRLHGGSGDDSLRGENGQDALFGDAGADTLRGDAGNDALTGGHGLPDTCQGDTGTDTADASCEQVRGVP